MSFQLESSKIRMVWVFRLIIVVVYMVGAEECGQVVREGLTFSVGWLGG
ncbi:hypothetical protein [Paenibacillus endoradicis]|nr:hypothetical protein [Paenibacillus endoradicis]